MLFNYTVVALSLTFRYVLFSSLQVLWWLGTKYNRMESPELTKCGHMTKARAE